MLNRSSLPSPDEKKIKITKNKKPHPQLLIQRALLKSNINFSARMCIWICRENPRTIMSCSINKTFGHDIQNFSTVVLFLCCNCFDTITVKSILSMEYIPRKHHRKTSILTFSKYAPLSYIHESIEDVWVGS